MAKKFEERKLVVIPTFGTIHVLGGLTGPVLTPFYLDTEKIFHLINTKHHVKEVLEDGTQIELDIDNYNTVNSKTVKESKQDKQDIVKEPIQPADNVIDVDGDDSSNQSSKGNKNNQKNNKK